MRLITFANTKGRRRGAAEVRPFESPEDYLGMIEYFSGSPDELLLRMGVSRSKLLTSAEWLAAVWADHWLRDDDPRRERFYLAWVHDQRIVGHSSLDRIQFADQARAHLHLWNASLRGRGWGTDFFRASVTTYFKRFRLKRLIVEPKADNAAPNRVVVALGFRLVRTYRTVPGPIQFEQDVNTYEISDDEWRAIGDVP